MTASAPTLKLVPNDDIDKEIAELGDAMRGDRLALLREKRGQITVLPPEGALRLNDIENAERFLGEFGDNLRFCPESGKWLTYSGKHWEVDNEFFVMEYARDWVKGELETAITTGDKWRIKNGDRLNNNVGFDAMLKQAKYQRATPIAKFDAESSHYLLNCANGTLDLKTGKLREHRRDDFITRVISTSYDEAAKCPTFDRFLADIQPDAEVRAFLQRSIGYSLIGDVPDHAFWILYGIGNNGKSVFTSLFLNMLGAYASGMSAESLMMGVPTSGSSASGDIARMKGKRFVLVSESNEYDRISSAKVKAFSAGDSVTARFLFKEDFDFKFTGKMWIATNHKPTITDPSKGMWRRVKLVPFKTNIDDDKLIKPDILHARLMAEASGILNWAVQGCRDYLGELGLSAPKCIQDEIDQYKLEQDSIAQFLLEECRTLEVAMDEAVATGAYINPADFQVGNTDLYAAYVKYCKANGEKYICSQKKLSQKMKERGFHQKQSYGRYWEGIYLIS